MSTAREQIHVSAYCAPELVGKFRLARDVRGATTSSALREAMALYIESVARQDEDPAGEERGLREASAARSGGTGAT